jgi:hypothetical protein
MGVHAARVRERVVERIRTSEYVLTVRYPLVRPTPAGVFPLPPGASPLTPKADPQAPVDDEGETVRPEVAVPCLFTELWSMASTSRDKLQAELGGWALETEALARVVDEDVDLPDGGTVFDGAASVVVTGRKYRVLAVRKLASSGTIAGTYYVMLTGAAKH